LKGKTILLVDDEKKVLFLLSDALEEQGFTVRSTTHASEALKILQEDTVDAVVLDLVMPGIDGVDTLQAIKEMKPHLPVIMLSGHGTIEKAVKTLKLGAHDFLEKPVSSDKIGITLRNAITQSMLEKEKSHLLETVREEYRMIGSSDAMKEIYRLIEKIAVTDSPVLITGENGTGKELIARALHFKSQRGAKPFVPLNCAAIPENLLESELFGHEKGAFTDAVSEKAGLFEQAHTGTLFLDEISETSLRLQPKLLRALETMEIQRVGGTSREKVDVRIISATNKDLDQAIREKTFREDLFYRVAVLTMDVPPLRERKEDIPELVEHFSRMFCRERKMPAITFHPHTMELVMQYPWPGNIRQLKNLVEKVVVLSDEKEILPETIRPHLPANGLALNRNSHQQIPEETLEEARKRVEKEKLLAKLHAMNWDYKAVAKELNISRATLFNKMKAYGISGKRKR
jgi:two-component system nitrogen regulation response regulator NtrX